VTDLAATDRQMIDRAAQLEREIQLGVRSIRAAWVLLAERLYEFHRDDAWQVLGFDSFNEWLAAPEIDLGYRQTMRLIEAYREMTIERGISRDSLELAEITKVAVVLPAVKAGTVSAQDALADAQTLSRTDLEEKYRGDPSAGLDAEAEPEWHRCPECGKAHQVKT
jgi:hypothetical protein